MRVRLHGILAAVFVFGVTVPTFAHHNFGVEFDRNNCMDLKGTLTGVTWENPHAWIDVTAKDAKGTEVTWHLEMVTPNALRRNGTYRQDFEAAMGKAINVRACRARDLTTTKGAASYLQLPDGEIRSVGQNVERRAPEDRRF
jgi:hypothetical protein